MKVVIVGCGRVGSSLAAQLAGRGDEVTVVDRNARSFGMLEDDLEATARPEAGGPGAARIMVTRRGFRCVLGVGIDEDILRSAGLPHADAFAAVTDSDYSNIMAGLMAREIFQVPRVIARLIDARWSPVCQALGIESICPAAMGARSIADQLAAPPAGR